MRCLASISAHPRPLACRKSSPNMSINIYGIKKGGQLPIFLRGQSKVTVHSADHEMALWPQQITPLGRFSQSVGRKRGKEEINRELSPLFPRLPAFAPATMQHSAPRRQPGGYGFTVRA